MSTSTRRRCTVRRRCAAAAAAALLLALGAACGDDSESLQIVSPTPDTEVQVPFEVTFDTSVPLGSPEDDLHHLHVWFSDDETAYLVVESTTVEISQAPPGDQVLHASLREPDHTRTGVETSVRIVVAPSD